MAEVMLLRDVCDAGAPFERIGARRWLATWIERRPAGQVDPVVSRAGSGAIEDDYVAREAVLDRWHDVEELVQGLVLIGIANELAIIEQRFTPTGWPGQGAWSAHARLTFT